LLYVFNKKQQGFDLPAVAGTYTAMKESSTIKAVPEGKYVLTIDFCDLQYGKNDYADTEKESFTDQHLFNAAEKAYVRHGFIAAHSWGNPWNTSVQFKDHTVRRDTFKTGGFRAIYHFTVAGDFDKSDMQAVVERPELYKVSLNGKALQPEAGQWFVDREMCVFNIGDAVQKGANSLVLDCSPMRIMAEIEQVIIRGNFTVQPAAKGWTIHPPVTQFTTGSWKAQGWNFYPGIVSYVKTYDITETDASYQVRLGEWAGTVAEVLVNGESAGIIGFEPYSADVTGKLKQGANSIEVKIVGSNRNLFGPFHPVVVGSFDSSVPGIASPSHFRFITKYPSGNEYRQLDYGLMDDFWLEKGNNK
jgi:hypothetical protein